MVLIYPSMNPSVHHPSMHACIHPWSKKELLGTSPVLGSAKGLVLWDESSHLVQIITK